MRAFAAPPCRTFLRRTAAPPVLVVSLLTFSTCLAAQGAAPERKVAGHAIISELNPSIRIELPQTAVYVGGDRFVLYLSDGAPPPLRKERLISLSSREALLWLNEGQGEAGSFWE